MTPRRVRPLPEFFHALDQQLSEERGPNGEPSRYDFLSLELPEVMEDFALCPVRVTSTGGPGGLGGFRAVGGLG